MTLSFCKNIGNIRGWGPEGPKNGKERTCGKLNRVVYKENPEEGMGIFWNKTL